MKESESLVEALGRVVTYDDFVRVCQMLNGRTAQDLFETLFPLAIRIGPASGTAARMLIELQPSCSLELPVLLGQIHAAQLDASNREVPFYLVSQFGQRAVLQEAAKFLALLPKGGPRSKVDAISYWASMPAAELCKRFHLWEAEDGNGNADA
jgi:hypothetical protein